MANGKATLQVEHGGKMLVLEVGVTVLELLEPTVEHAQVSSAAPSPWSAKGFRWDDAFSLVNASGDVIAMVSGQLVTIWNDDLTQARDFTVPEGNDPRLFAWNKLCELSWHTCTPADTFPEVSL